MNSFSFICSFAICAALFTITNSPAAAKAPSQYEVSGEQTTELHWNVRIPLRDGVNLSATLYRPVNQGAPAPCIFTITPYIAEISHNRGIYFSSHGLPFLAVDARGRGNSEGVFRPDIQEAQDGYDVVEWLAKQPYCNGKVGMWGGSYAGTAQWSTAKEKPPHLATIVPAAAAHYGADVPFRNNVLYPYDLQWLFYMAGHASQENIFNDTSFWNKIWLKRFKDGAPFSNLVGAIKGFDPPSLRDWIEHPEDGLFYDVYNPTIEQYRAIDIPILTITGIYDADQPGAMTYYKDFMRVASKENRAHHYLIIGPWDHPGTRTPKSEVGGLKFGPASLVDLPKLHTDWYNWTMADGSKPEFLKKMVAYYVTGEEKWRYADNLEAVTAAQTPFFLGSKSNAVATSLPGSLATASSEQGKPDHYIYDPQDLSTAALEMYEDPFSLVSDSMLLARDGKHLVYETAPFSKDTEVSGFFRLRAWIALDQPDTDFDVKIYEVDSTGRSILLTTDILRARYRESFRAPRLINTKAPLEYDFNHFTFVSRLIASGHRLRLAIGPINSIAMEKNYNSGKPVATETLNDARVVTVWLSHDASHQSALYVPFGQPE